MLIKTHIKIECFDLHIIFVINKGKWNWRKGSPQETRPEWENSSPCVNISKLTIDIFKGTCYDLLDCSTVGARQLFCNNPEDGTRYCRKSCGFCGLYNRIIFSSLMTRLYISLLSKHRIHAILWGKLRTPCLHYLHLCKIFTINLQ